MALLQNTRYCIKICCCLLVAFIVFISSSPMEDKLETEIDPRLPSSFPISELVHPRLFAFNKLVIHKYGELPSSLSIANWEVFAYKWVALNFNSLIEPWFQSLNKMAPVWIQFVCAQLLVRNEESQCFLSSGAQRNCSCLRLGINGSMSIRKYRYFAPNHIRTPADAPPLLWEYPTIYE